MHFNIGIEFVHLYCVGKDDWKRDWIRTVWVSVKFAFKDAMQLADEGWRGFNYVSDTEEEVPYCDISFQGFECDSVSTLQSLRSAFVDCVKNRIGKTGTTCSAVLEHIAILMSPINFLENVKTIGQHNLKHIQDIANSVGFVSLFIVESRRVFVTYQEASRACADSTNGMPAAHVNVFR